MPFYEYECQSCKFYVELMQKISDPPLKKCPSCGKSTVKKLISAPAFRLKGSGWYETDFKSDKEDKRNLAAEKEPEAKEAKPAETAATPDSTETEAKPAAESKPAEAAAKPAADGKRRSTAASRRSSSRGKPKPKPKPKARPRRKARR